MPRRNRRRPRRRRRFRGRRRGLTTRQAAFRALSRVDPEKKYHDILVAESPYIGNPHIILMNGIAEGVGNSQRIGDSCKFLSMQWKMVANLNATTPLPAVIKVMFLVDTQSNGNLANENNIILDTGAPITSPLNLNNSKRFRVLSSTVMNLDPNSKFFAYRSAYRKLRLMPRWNGSGGTIGNVATGALLCYMTSNVPNALGAAQGPFVELQFRLRFVG